MAVEYVVTPIDPVSHRFRVVMRAPVDAYRPLQLHLARWIPGSYVLRDFARHMLSIEARCEGEPVAVTAVSGHSWECTPTGAQLCVTCEFFAHDDSVRAAWLDDRRGFFNFTSLALRVEALADAPCRVTLCAPPDIDDWRVVTTLRAEQAHANGFGIYAADDYWDLIDHPVAMGRAIESIDFSVRGVEHAFVLLGVPPTLDRDRLARDLGAVCAAQADVFDALPASTYRFLAQLTAGAFGGLEHRESSVLQVATDALPAPADAPEDPARDKAYETLLGLCSHEYFHLWNVKRIRPAAVADSDLASEAYLRDLWAYEGVTSYYDDLGLVRAGVIDEQGYLDRLAELATRIERTPGRHRQSLAESSFDAWLKFYRPDENTPNAVVSYYGKGAQLALALDLELRAATAERLSLDTLMKTMWRDYGRHDRPVPENGLAEVAREVSGVALDDFFARWLDTAGEADWTSRLAHFGVAVCRRPAADDAAVVLGRLGLRSADGAQPRIMNVLDGGPGQRAGIAPGDRLVALDGREVRASLAQRLQRLGAGVDVLLHVLRGDELLKRTVTLGAEAAPEIKLSVDRCADDATHARRARWLHRDRGAS